MRPAGGPIGGPWFRVLLSLIVLGVLVLLLFPVAIIIPLSFSSSGEMRFPPSSYGFELYGQFFSSDDWLRSLLLSARVAVIVMLVATPIGFVSALALIRGKFGGKQAANAAMLSPLIVPHIVTGLALFFFYRTFGLYDSQIGLVLAHSILVLPLVIIIISASLKGFDEDLEMAAMSLGASWRRALQHVTFPLVRPGIIAGAILAFITSFDELILALFITGPFNPTLPKRMFSAAAFLTDPLISVVSSLLIIAALFVAVITLILAQGKEDVRV